MVLLRVCWSGRLECRTKRKRRTKQQSEEPNKNGDVCTDTQRPRWKWNAARVKAQKAFGQTGHPNISKEAWAQYLQRDRQINRPVRPNKDFWEKRRRANSAQQLSPTFPSSNAAKVKILTSNFGQTVKRTRWGLALRLQLQTETPVFGPYIPTAKKPQRDDERTPGWGYKYYPGIQVKALCDITFMSLIS